MNRLLRRCKMFFANLQRIVQTRTNELADEHTGIQHHNNMKVKSKMTKAGETKSDSESVSIASIICDHGIGGVLDLEDVIDTTSSRSEITDVAVVEPTRQGAMVDHDYILSVLQAAMSLLAEDEDEDGGSPTFLVPLVSSPSRIRMPRRNSENRDRHYGSGMTQ